MSKSSKISEAFWRLGGYVVFAVAAVITGIGLAAYTMVCVISSIVSACRISHKQQESK